ncbi:thiol:disulfide interchange protein [Bernardetia litoralis DSM 6794]|uniref:Thiol:disulfide interchange protein n=1 Tax=Bernardetia litoralis (strain ATCC 23117 / DSM 6794 / NBRC 15988 / NCIMB 1366 / Fx l1 / Sio-4) TaxID=880071 RepID=I4AJD4_BERLS|nr:thiol:disulfide interchange protein [Bernardetia litoralis DSM 6794]
MLTVFFAVIALLLSSTTDVSAQIEQHSKWKTYTDPADLSNVKVGETIKLYFEVEIEKDWYVYSSDFDKNLGPIVTELAFEKNDAYQVVGDLKAVSPKKKYDDLWGGEYTYFVKKGKFYQVVKILKQDATIKTTLTYQECSEVSGKCIMQEPDFEFKVKAQAGEITETVQNDTQTSVDDTKNEDNNAEDSNENTTIDEETSNTTPSKTTESKTNVTTFDNTQNYIPAGDPFKELPEVTTDLGAESESLWGFMIAAFLSGLVALLTPCVFPMIPMTVSFFTSRSENRIQGIIRAMFYGFSIIGLYTLIGFIVSRFLGDDAANILATHWIPNVLFFTVFLIFAISFFGAFDIVLPSKMVNSIDKQADKGGYVGIFFMALTLVVVSFSCTGPIAGSILVMSAQGEVIKPILGMFAFSLAFALPFTLFAIFPSLLSNLPKSGGWLNTVKVVLGFIELALAFKFLSVADQVYHWGILDRPVYIVIWMSVAFFLGLYLIGKIRLPHDSIIEKLGVGRLLMAVVSFAFFLYLMPGLFGAPLSSLSGYLPPQSTNEFDLVALIRGEDKSEGHSKAKYSDILHLPHGIEGHFEYFEAIEAAKQANQPLFIDFTGHGCVNCREMEASVWNQSEILPILKNELTVVALYIDERQELTEQEKYTSERNGKEMTTVGKRNSDFQIRRFGQNAQPNYFLINPYTHQPLVAPVGKVSTAEFKKFLETGMKEFQKQRLSSSL